MEKVLVTGVAGFIGYHLVKNLLRQGFIVYGIDNINEYYDINLKYDRLEDLGIDYDSSEVERKITFGVEIKSNKNENFTFYRCNLEDKSTINSLFKAQKFDFVVNLAAQAGVRYSIENPSAYIDSNIIGFFNIIEACRYFPVKHLVYASSSSVYGANAKIPFSEEDQVDAPVSLYAATKKSNELMAYTYSHLYNIKTTGLRFFTVYGPWGRPDMSPILFADAIKNGKPLNVFNNGEMERDFTYVEDIVHGTSEVMKAIPEENKEYRIMNIGNGNPVNLMRFIETIEKSYGMSAQKNMMPMQPGDVKRTWADTTKIDTITNYTGKKTIEEGVKHFINWYKNYYK